jgi:hypothetical protein
LKRERADAAEEGRIREKIKKKNQQGCLVTQLYLFFFNKNFSVTVLALLRDKNFSRAEATKEIKKKVTRDDIGAMLEEEELLGKTAPSSSRATKISRFCERNEVGFAI